MVEPIDASRSEPLSAPKPRRASWVRLSLRSGLVLITLIAILLGFKYEQLHQRKRAVSAIKRMGGEVYYDFQLDPSGLMSVPDQRSDSARRLAGHLGDEFYQRVSGVFLNSPRTKDDDLSPLNHLRRLEFVNIQDTSVRGAGLRHLLRSKKLHTVRLNGSLVGDTALEHLGRIGTLQRLYLERTLITDEGLYHLAGLKQLSSLDLSDTQITDRGLGALQAVKSLRRLWLHDVKKVSSKGIRRLQRVLPKLVIGR